MDEGIYTFVIGVDECMDDLWYMISHPKIDKIIPYITGFTGLGTFIAIGLIIN